MDENGRGKDIFFSLPRFGVAPTGLDRKAGGPVVLAWSGRKGPRQGKGNGRAETDGVREPIFALREPARVSDAPTRTQMPSALHA
jgi:hypothetical protein